MLFKGLLCLSYTALLIGRTNATSHRRDELVQRKYEHQLKDALPVRLQVRQQPRGNQTTASGLQTSSPVAAELSSSSVVILPTTDNTFTTVTTNQAQTSASISSSTPISIALTTHVSSESSGALRSSSTKHSSSEQPPLPSSSSIVQTPQEPTSSTAAISATSATPSTANANQPASSSSPTSVFFSSTNLAPPSSQPPSSSLGIPETEIVGIPSSTSQSLEATSTSTKEFEEPESTSLTFSDIPPQSTQFSTQSTQEFSTNVPEPTSAPEQSSISLSFFVPLSTFRTSAIAPPLFTSSVQKEATTAIDDFSFSLFEPESTTTLSLATAPSISFPTPSIPTSEGLLGTTSDRPTSIDLFPTGSLFSSINLFPTGVDSILSDLLNIPTPTLSTSSLPLPIQTGGTFSIGSTSVNSIPVSETLKSQFSGFITSTGTLDRGATSTGISFSGVSGTGSRRVSSIPPSVRVSSSGGQLIPTTGALTTGFSRSQDATFTGAPTNQPANSTAISGPVPTIGLSGSTNTLDISTSNAGPVPTDLSNANTTTTNPTEADALQTTSPTNSDSAGTSNTVSESGALQTDTTSQTPTTFATDFGATKTAQTSSSTATETEESKPAPPLTKTQTAGIAVGSATCLLVAVVAALYFVRRKYQQNQRRHSTGGVYPEVAYLYDPPVGGNGVVTNGDAEAGRPDAMMSGGAAGSRSLTPDSTPYGAVPHNSPDGTTNNSTDAFVAVPLGTSKPSPRPSSYGGTIRDTRGDYTQLTINPIAFNPAAFEYPPMSPYALKNLQANQNNPENRHNGPVEDEHSHLLAVPSRTSTPDMAPVHLPPSTPMSPLGAYFTWRESGAAPRHSPPPSNSSSASRSTPTGRYTPTSSANSSPYSDQGSFTDASTVTLPRAAYAVPVNKGWGDFKRYSDDRSLVPQPLNLSPVKRKPLPHSPSPHAPMPGPSQVLLSGSGLPLTVTIPRKTVGSKNKLDRGMGLEVPRTMYGASGKPSNTEEYSDDPVVHKKRSAETLFADPQHIGRSI